MKKSILYIFLFILISAFGEMQGQVRASRIQYTMQVVRGDTIYRGYFPSIYVFPPLKFKNNKEKMEYTKLVRDVKKALPYAKQVSQSIIETYEFMETLPDEKSKQKHLEAAQKYIMKEYKPKMKKLTKNQGKILVKLVDRETNSSAYDIVKALVGTFKATVYNTFAGLFGNSLKTQYEPQGRDKMIERIVLEIEQGSL